jgi:hypothetical protein
MLFDTHVNLHGEVFEEDLSDVISRAKAADVTRMLAICDKVESIDRIREICDQNENIWRSVGCHPHYAKDHLDLTKDKLIEYASPPDVVGIGETGLDYHYGWSPENDQKACIPGTYRGSPGNWFAAYRTHKRGRRRHRRPFGGSLRKTAISHSHALLHER